MPKDYPLRFSGQMRQHLRALRKQRGLTQAQLGTLVGVSQARIAEIEADPGLVNLDQMLQLLAAMDATLSIEDDAPAPPLPAKKAARRSPAEGAAAAQAGGRTASKDSSTAPSKRSTRPAPQSPVPSRTKKGAW